MSNFPLLRLSIVLWTAGLLAACGKAPVTVAPPVQAVTVITLKTEPLTLTRELPGRTSPFLVAEVRPQVTGLVNARLFTEGGLVKAGDALYQLDDASYRAEADSARAALARAEAAHESARLKAKRAAELIKIHAISTQDHDNAVAALREAEADVGVARAALKLTEVRLGYSRIAAPIAGRIGKSAVTPGALITANQVEPLATIQQLDPIHVDLSQSSGELLALRKALGDEPWHASSSIVRSSRGSSRSSSCWPALSVHRSCRSRAIPTSHPRGHDQCHLSGRLGARRWRTR
jgi:membrane fusion protein (multidrug efflux system)